MKSLNKLFFLLGFSIIFFNKTVAKPLIVLYLQHPPKSAYSTFPNEADIKLLEKIEKIVNSTPSKYSKRTFKNGLKSYQAPSLSGILVTYAGYMDYSKPNGEISFPLRHTPATKLYILISTNVTLVPVRSNTFGFEEITSQDPKDAIMYVFNKNKDKKGNLYWGVKKTSLPANNQLSPITMIIHTKPENMFVQEGDFLSEQSLHVILPNNVYLLSNYNNLKTLIKFLDDARYYEQITRKEDSPKDTIIESIIENN